jgi:prepilin-type N-terminal cleavage/methylation domain-containing protein
MHEVSRHIRTRRGFTLIEILIVIVMIAIVTAIAIPHLNVARIRSKSAVISMGTTMLALQREAISKQHNILVVIDQTKPLLQIVYDSTNDLSMNNGERERPIPLGQGIVFGKPASVTARSFGANAVNFTTTEGASGLPAMVFYRNGSAKEYGGLYVSTSQAMAGAPNHQGETWAMELVRATGRPQWYRWNGTTWITGF